MDLVYDRTLSAALAFAREGRIEEWVHLYLPTDGRNRAFSDGLRLAPRVWKGPIRIPLSMLTRICGPEEGMKWRVHPVQFEEHVAALVREIRSGGDLPPLIVHCCAEGLELNDGNHRLEAYRRLGVGEGWAVFWATEGEEEFFPAVLDNMDAPCYNKAENRQNHRQETERTSTVL